MPQHSLADDVTAYRRAVETLPSTATSPPPAGHLLWVQPGDVPGGLALSSWLFKMRLRARTHNEASRFRSPFEAALPVRRPAWLTAKMRNLRHPARAAE